MLTVTLTRGLPGSGKSTWAKAEVDARPGQIKRINKDDIRAMLDNSTWSKKNEGFVLKVRNQLIMMALEQGYHVIVDDTNLNPRHEQAIRELVALKGRVTVKIQDFTHVTVEECIERDLKRMSSVGEQVIRRMYNDFLRKESLIEEVPGLPAAIIVDLDGTLVNMGDRSPYDCSDLSEDTPNKNVLGLVERFRSTHKIIVVTGRDGQWEPQTRQWLVDNEIDYDDFFMRPAGDSRRDTVVKKEIFENHLYGTYNVSFVLEDRERVVEMYRELGLTCWQVSYGAY